MEDISGLPDVDLGPVIADLNAQDKDKVKPEPVEAADLGQFKNTNDLMKGYKEVQGFSTRVSQENKDLKARLEAAEAAAAEFKAQKELASYQPPVQRTQPKSFDEAWMEDPETAISAKVQEGVRLASIDRALAREKRKGAAEYQERYAYANMLTQDPQYAHLQHSAEGVEHLFELGDKLRSEQLKKSAGKALESLFGEPLNEEEINNLKTLVKGKGSNKPKTNKNNAYMPDTDTSTISGADTGPALDNSGAIQDAVNKDDVDGVIDSLFKGILAE